MLSPEEQMIALVRDVRKLKDQLRFYTRLQGIRLESRLDAGERQLWAVVQDDTATNDGAEYQLAP